ncbi:MAG: sugar ABC transporter permease [Acidimicrobiales bacterium]
MRRVRERHWFGRESLLAYALLAPSLVLFAVFVYYPFVDNFRQGFYSSNPANPSLTTYVGFDQWRAVLDVGNLGKGLARGAVLGLIVVALVVIGRVARARLSTSRRRPSTEAPGKLAVARRVGAMWLVSTLVIGIGVFAFSAADDRGFAHSLRVTFVFWMMIVPPTIILGLLAAVLGHRVIAGVGTFRTLFMMSLATGVGVAGTIFFTLLNPQVGLLPWLGVHTDPAPLQNPTWALLSVAVFVWWLELGSAFIFLSAGLQNIPDQLYEAALVDGAGPVRRFFRITLPMLSPMLVFVFILGSILGLVQSFPVIDITTGGAPVHRTETLAWLIVETTRGTSQDYGKAAVLSVALFFLAFALTLVQLTFLERRVTYGEGQRS